MSGFQRVWRVSVRRCLAFDGLERLWHDGCREYERVRILISNTHKRPQLARSLIEINLSGEAWRSKRRLFEGREFNDSLFFIVRVVEGVDVNLIHLLHLGGG